jgi:hypothetical protein
MEVPTDGAGYGTLEGVESSLKSLGLPLEGEKGMLAILGGRFRWTK